MKRKCLFFILLGAVITGAPAFSQDLESFQSQLKRVQEYLSGNDFNGASAFLKRMPLSSGEERGRLAYLSAYIKIQQLKYWEETQKWDELYGRGKNFKEEIISSCQEIVRNESFSPELKLRALALEGIVYSRDQNEKYYDIYSSLLQRIKDYLESKGSDIQPVFDIASIFYENDNEKFAARIYQRILKYIKQKDYALEKIKQIAADLYDKNREFSAEVYGIYVDKLKDEDAAKYTDELTNIFYLFCDYGFKETPVWQDRFSAALAEKIHQEIQDAPPSLKYLLAFNLQRAKDYTYARKIYKEMLKETPAYLREELLFKVSLLSFFLGDEITFEEYLSLLEARNNKSIFLPSLYYLKGVWKHYQKNFNDASDYYNQAGKFPFHTAPAIDEMQSFLLKGENDNYIPAKVKIYFDLYTGKIKPRGSTSLYTSRGKVMTGEKVTFDATFYLPGLGCMQPQMVYLWWGALGKEGYPSGGVVQTVYRHPGGMPVFCSSQVSSGFLERVEDLVDVYKGELKGLKERYSLGDTLEVSFTVRPPLYKDIYKVCLVLLQDGKVVRSGTAPLKFTFKARGKYRIRVEIYALQDVLLHVIEGPEFEI